MRLIRRDEIAGTRSPTHSPPLVALGFRALLVSGHKPLASHAVTLAGGDAMPGVFRPYTLIDVLGQIQQQAIGDTDTSVSGVGYFAEADETMALADSVTATAGANPAWGGGTWGAVVWS
jgi:hypothetical protein